MKIVVERSRLMAERLFPGTGWIGIIILSCYAGFLVLKIIDPQTSERWRILLCLTFPVLFFSQLAQVSLGFSCFLMNRNLHFPIPELIFVSPVYMSQNFFILIPFASEVL